MRRSVRRCAGLALSAVLLCSGGAFAQRTTATVHGIVQDASQAVIPGATVTVINEETAGKYEAITNDQGEFTLSFLPVGTYTVEVKMAGFKRFRETSLQLVSGQELRYTVHLELGGISDQITVTGQAPMIQNVNATVRKTFANDQVKELPLSQRDWTRLLYLDPGARRADQNVTFNGLASRGNTITVDGTEASGDIEQPTLAFYQNFNVVKTVSLEAIEEVQLTKGVMTAETGLTFGANINLVTKGGTNELHGSIFYNWQNNVLNARNLLNPEPQPMAPVRFHQFGGSVGGPVIKDKLFFFGVYEGYRDRNSSISNDMVFTTGVSRCGDSGRAGLQDCFRPHGAADRTVRAGSTAGPLSSSHPGFEKRQPRRGARRLPHQQFEQLLIPVYPRPSGVLWSADQWKIILAQVSGGAGSRDRKLHALRDDLER